MEFKSYTVKVKTPSQWEEFHNTLLSSSSVDHIPDREVTCSDDKKHSSTRGTYLLTDDEAENLREHHFIDWVELCPTCYPDLYPKPEGAARRFKRNIKVYRDLDVNTPKPPLGYSSINFDPTDPEDDGLSIPFDSSLNILDSDFTFETFFKYFGTATDVSNNGPYTIFHLGNNSNLILRLITTGGNVVFEVRYLAGSSNNYFTSTPITSSTWHHVALVKESSTLKVFFNGTEIDSRSVGTFNSYSGPFTIGVSGSNTLYLDGRLSSLRFVIGTALYTSNFTPPTLPLTNIENTRILTCISDPDFEATGREITLIGSPELSTDSPAFEGQKFSYIPDTVTPIVTGSVDFDGTGDYLTFSSGFTMGTGDFTVECFAYTRVVNQRMEVWINGGNIGGFYLSTGFNAADAGPILNRASPPGSGWTLGVSGPTLTSNTWHHIAWVRESGIVSMYIDGVKHPNTLSNSNDTGIMESIGGWSNGEYSLDAIISNLRIVKGTALYTSAFTPPTQELDATYRTVNSVAFDGDDGLSATYDSSFNLGTSDFTMEAFVKYSGAIATDYTVFNIKDGNNHGINVRIGDSSGFVIVKYSYAGQGFSGSGNATGVTLTASVWNHIAVVKTPGDFKIFVNGQQAISTSFVNPGSFNYSGQAPPFYIGVGNGGNVKYFNGSISNVRFVNGTALYTSNFTPPTGPLENITNTVLLACNSSNPTTETTGKTVTAIGDPSTITDAPFDTTASLLCCQSKTSVTENATNVGISSFGDPQVSTDSPGLLTGGFDRTYNSPEVIRTNWAVKRVGLATNGDFWTGTGNLAPEFTDVGYNMTGKNVDIIIQDSGVLQYHPEFMDGKGQSRVRDIVLDGPLYIDPTSSYLQANTYTKADGRIGIATAAAHNWWNNNSSGYRSADFDAQGTTGSVLFDGTGDYLTVPNSSDLQFEGEDFTIQFWVRPNPQTGSRSLVTKGINPTVATDVEFDISLENDRRVRWRINSSGTLLNGLTNTALIENQWSHFAITKEGSTTRVFVNGILEASFIYGNYTIPTKSQPLYIGSSSVGDFNGYISNLSITKGRAVYTSATGALGTPIFTPPTEELDGTSTGTTGSVEFDGVSNDRLAITSASDLQFGSGDFTIEAFVKTDVSATSQTIVTKATSGATNNEFIFRIENTDQLVLAMHNGSSYSFFYSNVDLLPDQWYHVAATREGTRTRLFIDGVDVSLAVYNQTVNMPATTTVVNVGTRFNQARFDGHISNVRLIKGKAIYTSNFTRPTTELLPTYSDTTGSATFGSSDEYLQIGTGGPAQFISNNFTIEFWIYHTSATSENVRWLTTNGGGSFNAQTFAFGEGSNGTIRYNRFTSTVPYTRTPGTWQHIAYTRESGTERIFVDGVLLGSAATIGNYSDSALIIGGRNTTVAGQESFEGNISNLRIVKGTALYTSNFTPPTEELTAITGTSVLCCQSKTDPTAGVGNFTNVGVVASTLNPGIIATKTVSLLCCQSKTQTTQEATGKTIGTGGSPQSGTDFPGLPWTSNAILLCCQSKTSATEENTGKTITAIGNAVASSENPGLIIPGTGTNDFGTIAVNSDYTAEASLGQNLDGTSSLTNGHGTACAGLAAGKNAGVAFEANIWNMSGIFSPYPDALTITTEQMYDLMKVFHKYKPVNPEIGVKNPTIVNGSWGYGVSFSPTSSQFTFRGTTDFYTGSVTGTGNVLLGRAMCSGFDDNRFSLEPSEAINVPGDEFIAEGPIFVSAAGNDNQKLGIGANDPDRLNELVGYKCSHRDFMHPQGIGFDSANDYHPTICVGAMDEFVETNYEERKASYSNNGSGIDVWAPADETLAPGTNGVSAYEDFRRSDDTRFYDCRFNGTSAAAPVATGVIALYLQSNPRATQRQTKNWLNKYGSKIGSPYRDDETNDQTTLYWTGQYNMRGAEKRILFNPYYTDPTQPQQAQLTTSGVSFGGVSISLQ